MLSAPVSPAAVATVSSHFPTSTSTLTLWEMISKTRTPMATAEQTKSTMVSKR
jgi:hypothetical protein